MDVETVDQEYAQLQQESSELTTTIQGFATKLQGAIDGGDAQAREWILDLKGIALQIQQEQIQMQALLQALHAFAVNNLPQPQAAPLAPAPAPAAPVAMQQAAPQGGGIFSRFLGGGFGQAMTTGIGMGAGFGIADGVISSMFDN